MFAFDVADKPETSPVKASKACLADNQPKSPDSPGSTPDRPVPVLLKTRPAQSWNGRTGQRVLSDRQAVQQFRQVVEDYKRLNALFADKADAMKQISEQMIKDLMDWKQTRKQAHKQASRQVNQMIEDKTIDVPDNPNQASKEQLLLVEGLLAETINSHEGLNQATGRLQAITNDYQVMLDSAYDLKEQVDAVYRLMLMRIRQVAVKRLVCPEELTGLIDDTLLSDHLSAETGDIIKSNRRFLEYTLKTLGTSIEEQAERQDNDKH